VFWVYCSGSVEALAALAEVILVPRQFLYAPLYWTCLRGLYVSPFHLQKRACTTRPGGSVAKILTGQGLENVHPMRAVSRSSKLRWGGVSGIAEQIVCR
jgi:hypothetical protein